MRLGCLVQRGDDRVEVVMVEIEHVRAGPIPEALDARAPVNGTRELFRERAPHASRAPAELEPEPVDLVIERPHFELAERVEHRPSGERRRASTRGRPHDANPIAGAPTCS